MSTRVERDSMGEIAVPADALYGAQTQRAIDNFQLSGLRMPRPFLRGLGLVKAACARVNQELGLLDAAIAAAVFDAAMRMARGELDAQFPLDIFQTGSGTSTNMNANEVIAHVAAARKVHPNDHVNMSQSSNDVIPTAIHVSAALLVEEQLRFALDALAGTIEARAAQTQAVVKTGRTHLMDAMPLTVAQELGGWAAQIRHDIDRIDSVAPRLRALALGGTAVGTGINTPRDFAQTAIRYLNDDNEGEFTEADNHFEAQGTQDSVVAYSGALRTYAVGLVKICNDLRWMGSGPTAGLAEIHLQDLQPGSSIMPGKVNPVIPEATLQVCAQVIGNDATITFAGASGSFELNVMLPVIARNVLESIELLTRASRLLATCVEGITADLDRMRAYAESSPSIVTPLNKYVGYEAAARIAKQALADGATIRQTVIDLGYVDRGELTEEQLDEALDVERMTHP